MVKFKGRFLTGILVVPTILSLMLSGCSSTSSKSADSIEGSGVRATSYPVYDNGTEGILNDQVVMVEEGKTDEVVYPEVAERKIISRISYSIETKKYTDSINTLQKLIDSTKSIVSRSDQSGDEAEGTAYSNFTLRVPTDQVKVFEEGIGDLGNLLSTFTETEDVTGEYFDTEARLTVLNAQEKRVLELLDKAETIEEILQIENELTRIRTEIEQYTTTVKRLDSLTKYATITLSLSQTKDYTVKDETLWGKFVQLCKDSVNGFINTLGSLGSAIMMLLPYVLIITIVVVIIVRMVKKKKAKKAAEKQAESTDKE